MGDYQEMYDRSIADPESFWGEQAGLIDWIKKPQRVLDADNPPFYRWFPDATLNTCYNALDRHVINGHADRTALIYDSAVTGTKSSLTYAQLLEEVAAFAGVLRALGVEKGDRVVIYMPMIPEAVIAMLASARLGAVHSVVFGGFAPHELAVRIDDAQPKVVVTASCGIEPSRTIEYKPFVDKALDLAEHKPGAVVLKQRPEVTAQMQDGRDLDWDLAMKAGRTDPAPCVEVAATDPLYVLYTSGTTGKPKGIVRDNGGHAVAMAWSLPNIYGCGEGDVWWAASDVGWVVGHSYIVYSPLINGATTVLYEGKPVGTPDAGAFWRVISEYGVRALFTAPTAIRAIKKEDPDRRRCWPTTTSARWRLSSSPVKDSTPTPTNGRARSCSACQSSTTGGRPRPAGRSRQTCAASEEMPIKAGSPSVPVPGYDVQVLDEHGQPVGADTEGAIVSNCRCRQAPCRPCGVMTSATSRRTSRRSTATTSPATVATSTLTATST
jgi:propionyl-CoA synthetase